MAAGQMASISENLQEPQQQRIQKLAKAFGQKEAEEHGEIDESLCFVIISFSGNPILQDFYEKSIKPTVESLGYRCERIDEQEFNGSIRDHTIGPHEICFFNPQLTYMEREL